MPKCVSPAQVVASSVVYSVARSVVDELRGPKINGAEDDVVDTIVFQKTMKALKDKEGKRNG